MGDRTLGGRYALVRQLGSGGNAVIYEAKDLKIGRHVAVKVLTPPCASSPEHIERLEREGRIGAAVSHCHICAVTDIDHLDDGSPFLVLELLRGETIEARLDREQQLSVEQVVHIGAQLLAGLAAAHEHGIIHRDVKPTNVFLVDSGIPDAPVVKLIDFGTAQVPGMPEFDGQKLTRTGVVVGTAAYMSPEQVRGLRDFDARTDVYSAAVVLYEAISGRRPFTEESLPKLIETIAFKTPPPLGSVMPGVPVRIARAIDMALARERERRHVDARAFLEALVAPTSPLPKTTGVTSIVGASGSGSGDASASAGRRPSVPRPQSSMEDWELATRESAPPTAAITAAASGAVLEAEATRPRAPEPSQAASVRPPSGPTRPPGRS